MSLPEYKGVHSVLRNEQFKSRNVSDILVEGIMGNQVDLAAICAEQNPLRRQRMGTASEMRFESDGA